MDQPSRSPSEPKERAVSPDPCSTRPNPFDDDGTSARKRRRTSLNGASPSRSAETTPESARAEAQRGSVDKDITMTMDSGTSAPHTPDRIEGEKQPPVSETRHTKITLNLKKGKQAAGSEPSSLLASPNGYGAQENGIRASVEDSDADLSNASLYVADGASSGADMDNPPIEILDDDDDDDDQGPSQITILEDTDPISSFPYHTNQPLLQALHAICQHLPNGHNALITFRDWMAETKVWIDRHGPHKLSTVFREYRDFWHALPSFVLQYSSPSRTTIARNQQTQSLLNQFHSAFARLTAALVEADRALIEVENLDDDWQDYMSTSFTSSLSCLLTDYAIVLLPNMPICDPDTVWPEAIDRILTMAFPYSSSAAQNPIYALHELGFAAADLIPRLPRCTDTLQPILYLSAFLARGELSRQQKAGVLSNGSDQSKDLFERTYELYEAGARALAGCIEKSVNQISPGLAIDSIGHLTDLLRICFRSQCRQTQSLIGDHQEQNPAIPRAETAKVIVSEWRLEMYTKLIMSSQMQLRISAAQHMSTDLVRIWRDNQQENHEPVDNLSQQPILRHFSNQILQSGVVAYLLGPSCHPEVTAQSSNIIGFLFASHTFTEDLMDFMWRTITTCQISGVAESLLTTVAGIANLFSPFDFFNVFRKLETVSIENFTPTLKDFCDKIVAQLIDKNHQIRELLPYSLMFRLLREASAPGPHFNQPTQKWASTLLSHLLRLGPSPEDRLVLQQRCLQDIIQKTPYTLGSLHGLSLLIRPVSRARDLQQLTAEHNLTELLVDELEHAINTRQDVGIVHAISGPENAPRLELLTTVISHAQNAESISDDLGRRLWAHLVGERAASQEDRDCAWQSLSEAMKNAPTNPFLQICFQDYFPTLAPHFFRPGSLEFILHRIVPLLKVKNDLILEDEESSDHLAIEQLWRIALTAPSGTIEGRAISALVKDVYMDSLAVRAMPLYRARRVHLRLVNRCLGQMSSAAPQLLSTLNESKDKDNDGDTKIVSANIQEADDRALLFARSLTIVREFHKVHQQTPHFSAPDLRSLPLPEKNDMEGVPAELKYQSFDGCTQTDIKPLTIGSKNTAGSLLASIRQATGFDHYRVYYKGQPFNPTLDQVCQSLEELKIHSGLILVKREADDQNESPVFSRHGVSPVEIEIMRHFAELWQYLDLAQVMANEIFGFLVTLPVDDHILDLLRDEDTSYDKIFPTGHPLKSLYALHAMKEYLSLHCTQSLEKDTKSKYQGALRRLLQLVVSAISDPDVIKSCPDADLKLVLALRLVEQFSAILRDPLRTEESSQLLDQTLIRQLVNILSSSLTAEAVFAANLLIVTLQGIMDMCSLRQELWDWLSSHMDLRKTVQSLLIDDPRDAVRKSTGSIIIDKTTISISLSEVSPTDFAKVFWPLLMELIPHALSQPTRSLEVFNLAAIILVTAKESRLRILDMRQIAQKLCALLIDYDPSETPGMVLAPFPSQDIVQPGAIDLCAHGLVHLLHMILCGENDQETLDSIPDGAGLSLFSRLFPVRWKTADLLWSGGVVYQETTRFRLNDIVIRLVGRDRSQLKKFLRRLDSLVPCMKDEEAGDANQYRYDLPYYFDRAKDIRGACGYAGLRNLSNTCYLNSLCTQLFMNVNFRDFVLGVDVDERDRSRTLLHETQAMFACLQSTQRRFVDPEHFVASIKTYDDDCINIHNQMDVEEFFNLLNDRWEGQLRSHDAVRRFRSFYGGQLVTQTKSKECEHISEVLEPFSAIQCDIKGKKSLLESLEAYVDGEHMEGDNKYKCSTCDRHVDAVRRSCLKEIPDSLIFHLKRFDFNLRTQSRSKINDYFAFPDRIDMKPYTVEHLSNPSEGSAEDWFELVGVLVHAGTAESGHYYSFIRERPTSRKDDSWFEFNDDVVSPWCPSKMEACCFGGTEAWESGGATYDKNYCAYMLFYERSSNLKQKQESLDVLGKPSPIQFDVPLRIAQDVQDDNLRVLQRHCLFDPDHLRLFDETIERMLVLNGSHCSDAHDMEDLAVSAAISHLDQVASRGKDVHAAEKLANRIRNLASNCQKCAMAAFQYFDARHEPLRMLVQRNPEAVIRQSAADMMFSIFCSLRQSQSEEFADEIVDGVCGMLIPLWASFHATNNHRSWPQVFELMARVVGLGKEMQLGFMDLGFFQKTLLVFLAEYEEEHKRDPQFNKLCIILNRRPNRTPNYASVIELVKVLLTEITPERPLEDSEERCKIFERDPSQKIRMTVDEKDLLEMVLNHNGNALVDKILSINQNPEATDEIIRLILDRQWDLEAEILQTLVINTKPVPQEYMMYKPYLRAAAVFCRHSTRPNNVNALISHIAKYSKLLSINEPKAVWAFFREMSGGDGEKPTDLDMSVQWQSIAVAPDWAPSLLAHYEIALGTQVEALLNEKIFGFGLTPQFDADDGGEERAEAVVKCARQLGVRCCEYVEQAFIRRGSPLSTQTGAVLQRIIMQCGLYFDNSEEDASALGGIGYARASRYILENLRRLSVDDLEDDGSGMSDDDSFSSDPPQSEYPELTRAVVEEWENSVGSSDQGESLVDDEMRDLDI